jgi:hypothetical protein
MYPDLFSSAELSKCNNLVQNEAKHIIDKYSIFANGNYSGVEFELPSHGTDMSI